MPRNTLALLPALTLTLATGCSEQFDQQAVALRFDATIGGEVASCYNAQIAQVPQYSPGVNGTLAALADARMLLSNVELREVGGGWVPLETEPAFPWRNQGVTLLDFENDQSFCGAEGTVITNKNLSGTLPGGEYEGLRFDVGVPFELNHLDASREDSPSSVGAMFIDVQNGYRFVRLHFVVENGASQRYVVELGNGGCTSGGPSEAPSDCPRENVATITLDDFVLGEDAIGVDLGQLVASADLSAAVPDQTAGCTPLDDGLDDCASPLTALGLGEDSGDCRNDCTDQTVFSLTELVPAE